MVWTDGTIKENLLLDSVIRLQVNAEVTSAVTGMSALQGEGTFCAKLNLELYLLRGAFESLHGRLPGLSA